MVYLTTKQEKIRKYSVEVIAKFISDDFAEAKVLKNCSLSGVEGKHCILLQLPQLLVLCNNSRPLNPPQGDL